MNNQVTDDGPCPCDCHWHPHGWTRCVCNDDCPERSEYDNDMGECPHDSMSGDEGPVQSTGRMPVRWRCDACEAIVHDNVVGECIPCGKPIIAINPTVDWVIKDGAHRTCAEQITGPLP